MPMKSVSAILTIVVLLSLTLACHAGNADPAAVHAKIKAGAMVVDVRTPAEFASGAYQGAINIPLDQVEKRLADFGDRKRPIVLYCRSGHRAGLAKAILESNGFSDVTNGGGLTDMPPRESRGEPPSVARRAPPREGLETHPGFPSRQLFTPSRADSSTFLQRLAHGPARC